MPTRRRVAARGKAFINVTTSMEPQVKYTGWKKEPKEGMALSQALCLFFAMTAILVALIYLAHL